VEASKDAPMSRPAEEEMALAREYGKRVAEVAGRLARVPALA
jgi:hypothetical protein